MSAPEVLALALATVVGSAAQSAAGFGLSLPLGPVAFALLSPPDAVLTVAVGSLMHNVLVLTTRHRRLAIRTGDAILLIAAGPPGLLVGALVVSRASRPLMQLAVGLAILAVILFRLHEPGRVSTLASRKAGLPIGLLAGLLTTTLGINAPPLVTWLRAREATFRQLRDTLAIAFLSLNVAAIPSLATHGGTIAGELVPALAAGLIAGHAFGVQAHNRLSTRSLDRLLVAILAVAGGASVIGSSMALV
ncbi:MAG: sulfite exporter TauE/SafE family protein [Solirubrobacteraceae bacterium]